MTTVTALETQAGQVLDQSYAQFKQAQLALGKEQIFANAAQILRSVICRDTAIFIWRRDRTAAIKLQDQVLPTMYQQGQVANFEVNFTGNDIRWLLDCERIIANEYLNSQIAERLVVIKLNLTEFPGIVTGNSAFK